LRSKNKAIPCRPELNLVIDIFPCRFLRHSFLLLCPPRFDFPALRPAVSLPEAATERSVATSPRNALESVRILDLS
jgi:hypothetical protein